MAEKCLVIGCDTSRILDENDRDSMIYADGSGAIILESDNSMMVVLSHKSATFTYDGENDFIFYGALMI